MKIQEIIHNIEILDSTIEQKEQQKKLIEEEKQELLIQKQDILSTLDQFNTFNIDTIGETIAKLLTVIDKKLMFIIQLINAYLYLNMICLVNT